MEPSIRASTANPSPISTFGIHGGAAAGASKAALVAQEPRRRGCLARRCVISGGDRVLDLLPRVLREIIRHPYSAAPLTVSGTLAGSQRPSTQRADLKVCVLALP